MISAGDKRMGLIAATILFWDQVTKHIVRQTFSGGEERVVFDGFFKLVHWHNTGAAWSSFHGHNGALAAVSLLALAMLIYFRRQFDHGRVWGQAALGLIVGGILGNLTDRISVGYVVDFLRFYLYQRSGNEIGFPAFNIADSAICIGVGLLLLRSAQEHIASAPEAGGRV